MTERQREVLDALARLPRDRGWVTTTRVNLLVGRRGVSARGILARLEAASLVERETSIVTGRHRWRITEYGLATLARTAA